MNLLLALTGGADRWPAWRGPLGTGEAPGADPPVKWSEAENVRWKVAVPGLGHSTPVVWEDRIYLTTAVPVGEAVGPIVTDVPGAHDNAPVTRRQRFEVLCLDRATGDVVWEKAVREALPHEGGHVSGTFASASPVTDGAHVWAFFGSYGLYCLDRDGTVAWEKDFGPMQSKHGHGEGASPALHGDTLVVNWDHEGPDFIVALDAQTGDVRWRKERDEPTSWSTPLMVEVEGRTQVVVAATNAVRAYDLATGDVVWECGGLSNNVVASPVAADGVLVAGSSYEKQAMLGVRLAGAHGDLAQDDHLLWFRRQPTPYVPSLLLTGGFVYFFHHYQPVLSRVEAATGKEPERPFRLPGIGNLYASPIVASDRIYIADLNGTTLVVSAGSSPQGLGLNHLDDSFSASPVAVGRQLLLRGRQFLYCLEEGGGK